MTSDGNEMYEGKWCCDRAVQDMLKKKVWPHYRNKPYNPNDEGP